MTLNRQCLKRINVIIKLTTLTSKVICYSPDHEIITFGKHMCEDVECVYKTSTI